MENFDEKGYDNVFSRYEKNNNAQSSQSLRMKKILYNYFDLYSFAQIILIYTNSHN